MFYLNLTVTSVQKKFETDKLHTSWKMSSAGWNFPFIIIWRYIVGNAGIFRYLCSLYGTSLGYLGQWCYAKYVSTRHDVFPQFRMWSVPYLISSVSDQFRMWSVPYEVWEYCLTIIPVSTAYNIRSVRSWNGMGSMWIVKYCKEFAVLELCYYLNFMNLINRVW